MLKKTIALLTALILTFSFAGFVSAAEYADTGNHWAKENIYKWSEHNVLTGSNGQFRPNDPMTRGELAVVLDRVFGYKEVSTEKFTDLEEGFYTESVLKAVAAGVLNGSDTKTISAGQKLTRQDAATIFARALHLENAATSNEEYADNGEISDYAKPAVYAMLHAGYMTGRPGKMFDPKADITRAEVVTVLSKAIKGYCNIPTTVSQDINGTVVIACPDVTLRDLTVTGDLIIAEGLGEGAVTLDNVVVTGNTFVRGGGTKSVIITGKSKLKNINIKKAGNAVSLKIDKTANVAKVNVLGGKANLQGTADTVNISGNAVFAAVSANIKNMDVTGKASVTVGKGSTVDTLAVTKETDAVNLVVEGTVTTLETEGKNTAIQVVSDARVDTLIAGLSSVGATIRVEAKGRIGLVTANAATSIVNNGTITKVDAKTHGTTISGTTPGTTTGNSTGGSGGTTNNTTDTESSSPRISPSAYTVNNVAATTPLTVMPGDALEALFRLTNYRGTEIYIESTLVVGGTESVVLQRTLTEAEITEFKSPGLRIGVAVPADITPGSHKFTATAYTNDTKSRRIAAATVTFTVADNTATVPAPQMTVTVDGLAYTNGQPIANTAVVSVEFGASAESVFYTTDSSQPTATNGTEITTDETNRTLTFSTTNLAGETVVLKAVAVSDTATSSVVSRTFTFLPEEYSLTLPTGVTDGTVDATMPNGIFDTGKYSYNTAVTVTAIPDMGFQVDTFEVNGVPETLTGDQFTFNITEDTVVNVTFVSM